MGYVKIKMVRKNHSIKKNDFSFENRIIDKRYSKLDSESP